MTLPLNRRSFLQTLGAGAGTLLVPGALRAASPVPEIPSYLKNYEKLYAENPRAAALQWFREARFGLFMHYGLYSLEGRHEWLQLREKIPVAAYAKLRDRFTAEKFDADVVTDLALAAQMRYVNLTTRHHDSFCLFDTKQTDFNSVLAMLAKARSFPTNLLLNTGPLPDGSIHSEDAQTLREAGRRIRTEGWPTPAKDEPAKTKQSK
jgi:hypothetical protein